MHFPIHCFSLFVYSSDLLRPVVDLSGGHHHGGGLQGVVAPPPGLPEDPLLPLVPLLGRRAVEVPSVQVGVAAVTEPPAAYKRPQTSGI